MANKRELTLTDVLNHHLKGGTFEYISFDFEKAKLEYEGTDDWQSMAKTVLNMFNDKIEIKDKYQIPAEIRSKYSYWRKGKLRQVDFNPNGSIKRIRIGARYAVSFNQNNLYDLKLTRNGNSTL